MTTPLEYYQQQLANGKILADPEQLHAMQYLQRIYTELLQEHKKRNSIIKKLRKPHLAQGLYLWGGVGIGKTFMMDCFYHCIPFSGKMRMHFHPFMRMVHQELKKHQGEKNPLQLIAKNIAKNKLLICFDEFYVNDIADAMILARLLKALFAQGVCLVTTSNTMPDELYKRGLQRDQFLPAIALLKAHTHIMHIPSQHDYRLRHLQQAGVFYTPNNSDAKAKMEKAFAALANQKPIHHEDLIVHERHIPVISQTQDCVWFHFADICSVPRSQQDYLDIAATFNTVFISDVPVIAPQAKNAISLFIRMIDVFYDAKTRLVLSAEKSVPELYPEGPMLADYQRARSRLLEMQSEAYFSAGL